MFNIRISMSSVLSDVIMKNLDAGDTKVYRCRGRQIWEIFIGLNTICTIIGEFKLLFA